MSHTRNIIQTIYLYLFSLVGLVLIVIASVNLINLGLKTWVFKQADRPVVYPEYPMARMNLENPEKPLSMTEETQPQITDEQKAQYEKERMEYEKANTTRERQRDASIAIAMLLVGIPLFLYHWRKVQNQV